MIEKTFVDKADRLARIVPHVLAQRGLEPCFSDWVLTRSGRGDVWLYGVLDTRKIARMERYTSPDLLHQVSTVARGVPVYPSNTNGLRYGFLLSGRPRLPGRVDFPGIERGVVRMGVDLRGEVKCTWDRLGHLLVAGMTGYGKSVFLRLLAHQAIADGARLLLADLDGATFPMLVGCPALVAPIAGNPQEAHSVVGLALGECDKRAALYAAAGGFPDSLADYNHLAVKSGEDPLPRLLVILDEYNATAVALGGARGQFASDTAALAWRGRKFGVNLVCAAQDFAKETVGRFRDQVAPVCFRVQSKELARSVGCSEAVHITRPGRAVTTRWGVFQAYYLDKSDLATAGAGGAGVLSADELSLALWAIEQNDGYLALADIQARADAHTGTGACTDAGARARTHAHGGQGYARRLASAWEVRGWLVKDSQNGNKRRVTDDLRQIAYKLKTLKTLKTLPTNPQTDLQTDLEQSTSLQSAELARDPLADVPGALVPIGYGLYKPAVKGLQREITIITEVN